MPGYHFVNLRVLVLDPNRHVQRLFSAVLQAFGCRWVRTVANPVEAWRTLMDFPADIAICEWRQAPGEASCRDFVKRLRTDPYSPNPQLPVIVSTAAARPEDVTEARDAGMTEFLAKPFTAGALYRRLGAIIDEPREFVLERSYTGPDRRRKRAPPPNGSGRRAGEVAGADTRPNLKNLKSLFALADAFNDKDGKPS